MTRKYSYPTCLALITLFFVSIFAQKLVAQTQEGITVTGLVLESGSGAPLKQVFISVLSTGELAGTDDDGKFTIVVPNLQAELIFDLPFYYKRNIFLNGRDYIEVSLISTRFRTQDHNYNSPLGEFKLKNTAFTTHALIGSDVRFNKITSFDQAFQGRVPGLRAINQSGMPGQRTFMNMRGYSSMYANSEPVMFIDGMIYDYSYANTSLLEGFALNPMDVVDIEDITDITIVRDGLSYLGSVGSNGMININTEQKGEASTIIKFSTYGGVVNSPQPQELLNASQFAGFFNEMLTSQGYSATQVNTMFPWLNGGTTAPEYYRYNNNTQWQKEIYSPSMVSKHHFFLKGGDDIATYNISTGYQSHNGIYQNANYNRFNLRINGTINITSKFTVTPNVKLSLADSKLANHGPSAWKNPLMATVLIPQNMYPLAKDGATGTPLSYLDDVGVFNVSNPSAIVKNAQGSNRNYHFLSSVKTQYKFSENLSISTLVGINFNNARENIFLPNIGLVQIDSAYNSPGDFVYEFRSAQSHTNINYKKVLMSGHAFGFNGGFRYMANSYKHNLSRDLNTPSDDFKRLGQGSQYSYLRTTTGDNRDLNWISYFGSFDYAFRDKYFLSTNISYDGNSATNANSRYHFYPSVGAAWRLSSEPILNNATWLDDLKLRGSYSVTGNMFSSVYDYSKLFYTSRRLNSIGVLTREIIPNENMTLEQKTTLNAGLDLTVFRQLVNVHVDVFQANVDNMVIQQTLPPTFGYTRYFDNGGKLESKGIEIGADTRIHTGNIVWTLGGTITHANTVVKELNFLDTLARRIVTPIKGGEFVTSVGNSINAFYGYKTNGLVSASDPHLIIGPKGQTMNPGDVKFVDTNNDRKIDEADKMIIGDPNPDFFGSLFAGFSWKRFELSAFFNYSYGNEAFNYVRYKAESMDSYSNQSASILNRWTPFNTNTTMPRASFGDPTGNTVFSDRWIEDASYLRLQQLTLSYKLPPYAGFYKGVVVYVTATNLFTLTKYSGYDPEFVYLNSPFYVGIDYGKIPQTQSFIIGLKLDL